MTSSSTRAGFLGGVGTLALLTMRPAQADFADAAQLRLIDQTGAVFRLADLRPHRTAVTFVATRCTDTCPLSQLLFTQLDRACAHAGLDACLLIVTLDPTFDTPFVVARRAADLQAMPPRFRFASGDPAVVRAILRAFGVTVETGADGIPDAHSTLIYVLDRNGRIVRRFPLSNRIDGILSALRG